MSTPAVIVLGILAWVLLAILLALFVGRMMTLRDRQRPDRAELWEPAEHETGDGDEESPTPPGGQPGNTT